MFGLKPSKFTEICGWYGMLAVFIAYTLVSFKVIPSSGTIYQLLNITGGAIGLIIVTAAKGVFQSVILNIFWAIVGVVALIGIIVR